LLADVADGAAREIQEIESLRRDRNESLSAMQFAAVSVERVVLEEVAQAQPPTAIPGK